MKGRRKWIIALIFLLLFVAASLPFLFGVVQMSSRTMLPLIHGESSPGGGDGDYLIFLKMFIDPRPGDLALVRPAALKGVQTIRRIASIAGGDSANEKTYVVEAERASGLDSKSFGPIPRSEIVGRVIYVYHAHR
jgi:signal peptidase I